MKTLASFPALLFCLFVFADGVFAQKFPYEEYYPRTLAEMIKMDETTTPKNFANGRKGLILHTDFRYSAVRVTYIGTSKALINEEKEYLKLWQGTLKVDPEIIALYENKYLFKECEKEHWIPVQKQVAAYFPKELKQGDMITLYLMYPGAIQLKQGGEWNYLFLVNEFQKY